jgi:hypothetical protein
VGLAMEFHVAPWVFENAPFHWYWRLRKWYFWKREKEWWDLPLETRQKIELERDADRGIVKGWDDELLRGEFN